VTPVIAILAATAIILMAAALARRDSTLRTGLNRAGEQCIVLLPRMVVIMFAAGFLMRLIPAELIGRFLGPESGMVGVLAGSLAALFVPSGGMVCFAIAASLAKEGAALSSLIAFVTAWSVFAPHRILIFEQPLLGARFVLIRLLSVAAIPFAAGAIALLVQTDSLWLTWSSALQR
jgi:uncharacterized protein